jgi:predicted membrane protein DUF2306
MNHAKKVTRIARLLRVFMYILAAIGIIMVVRRALVLEGIIPNFTPAGAAPFDSGFGEHPVITFLHILPGALFMILGPMQFTPGIRARYARGKRWTGRVFLVVALIVGVSAIAMPFVMLPIGGMNEAAASILFAIIFLVSISKAGWYSRRGNVALYREWMIRAFAIGLAISTIRPIIGLFFGFSGLPPQAFFGTAFWIGFSVQLLLAEVWINYTKNTGGV